MLYGVVDRNVNATCINRYSMLNGLIGTPPYCQGTKRVDNINHALIIEG